ncbi:MAG: glutamyl-tRNA reductase [Marine Group I thaumarchaeote]|nr:MAG: glutamyl-tRNA reductase [Marine Group I thaumarchaeote]
MSENNFDLINARVTFKNVPLDKLERFSFKDIPAACESFKKISGVSECVIVQNSFRVEIFLVINLEKGEAPDRRRSEGKYLIINKLEETWISLTELEEHDIDHFDQTIEVYKNTDVFLHLLKLASGLETIFIGRVEILDELKESISSAKQAEVSGRILNKLFDISLRVATRIRDSTEISKEVLTIGNIALKTAEEKAGLDGKKRVLLIGTGKTAAMVAKSLNKKAIPFEVASMTIERATGFSKILGGTPIKFEDALLEFDKFNIIFVATTADYFLINYERIKRVMENKKTGTMILDVSDPRAVDEKVSSLRGVKLMFRDQISEMYEENLKATRNKVPAVEEMVSKEVPIIEATMKRLEPEPLVKDVSAGVDLLRKKELEKALEKLGETDEKKIKIIDELTKAIAESVVSIPVKKSKKASE